MFYCANLINSDSYCVYNVFFFILLFKSRTLCLYLPVQRHVRSNLIYILSNVSILRTNKDKNKNNIIKLKS